MTCMYLSSDVPGPLAGEPVVVDSGRNWVTLSWPKSEVRGSAPVLAYRVEAWPLGGDGGARWIEVCVQEMYRSVLKCYLGRGSSLGKLHKTIYVTACSFC
jgi:hypothetical protein